MLEKIDLSDNQFGESEEIPVIDKICEVMIKNTSLGVFKFKHNGLFDTGFNSYLSCKKILRVYKKWKTYLYL